MGVDSPEIGERAFGEPIKWQKAVEILEEKIHLFKEMESMHYQVDWLDIENNTRKKHDHYHSIEAAYRSIEEWWQLHDYKPPYVRWIEKDTVISIDYGSHTQFYEIIKITE